MTQTELAKEQLEMAKQILETSLKTGDQELINIAKELHKNCERSVNRCEANPDLFGVDYDNLEY